MPPIQSLLEFYSELPKLRTRVRFPSPAPEIPFPCSLHSSRTLETFPARTLLVCVRPHALQLPCESRLTDGLPKRHTPPLSIPGGRQGRPGRIVDIQEIDTYTPANRRSTDLLAGVVQHPKNQCRWRKEHELFQTVYSGDSRPGMRVNLCCLRQRTVQGQHSGHGLGCQRRSGRRREGYGHQSGHGHRV